MGKKLRLVGGPEREVQKPRVLGHSSAIGLRILVLLVLVMGAVAGCGSEESRAKPPHMGAFLRVEGKFIEMASVKGRNFDADALPVFEGGRPTIWLWHEGVNLNLLGLSEQTVREPIPYHVTRTEEGIYILEVTEDLGPGTYCLAQGDPFLLSDMLSRWCFRVEGHAPGPSPSARHGADGVEGTAQSSPTRMPSVDPDMLATPPDDGLYLVVEGEPIELHSLDDGLDALNIDKYDWSYGFQAVTSRQSPVLLLQSERVSPRDLRFYRQGFDFGASVGMSEGLCLVNDVAFSG